MSQQRTSRRRLRQEMQNAVVFQASSPLCKGGWTVWLCADCFYMRFPGAAFATAGHLFLLAEGRRGLGPKILESQMSTLFAGSRSQNMVPAKTATGMLPGKP